MDIHQSLQEEEYDCYQSLQEEEYDCYQFLQEVAHGYMTRICNLQHLIDNCIIKIRPYEQGDISDSIRRDLSYYIGELEKEKKDYALFMGIEEDDKIMTNHTALLHAKALITALGITNLEDFESALINDMQLDIHLANNYDLYQRIADFIESKSKAEIINTFLQD